MIEAVNTASYVQVSVKFGVDIHKTLAQ